MEKSSRTKEQTVPSIWVIVLELFFWLFKYSLFFHNNDDYDAMINSYNGGKTKNYYSEKIYNLEMNDGNESRYDRTVLELESKSRKLEINGK